MQMTCDKCGGSGIVDRPYLGLIVNPNLLEQTPHSVWQEYLANGYTLHEAIACELSYGDSLQSHIGS